MIKQGVEIVHRTSAESLVSKGRFSASCKKPLSAATSATYCAQLLPNVIIQSSDAFVGHASRACCSEVWRDGDDDDDVQKVNGSCYGHCLSMNSKSWHAQSRRKMGTVLVPPRLCQGQSPGRKLFMNGK
ncbi:TPA: hypothetical protein ACH3X3_007474 [Trebouxia sp. C0006]